MDCSLSVHRRIIRLLRAVESGWVLFLFEFGGGLGFFLVGGGCGPCISTLGWDRWQRIVVGDGRDFLVVILLWPLGKDGNCGSR